MGMGKTKVDRTPPACSLNIPKHKICTNTKKKEFSKLSQNLLLGERGSKLEYFLSL